MRLNIQTFEVQLSYSFSPSDIRNAVRQEICSMQQNYDKLKTFKMEHNLQQGTVNTLILFSLYVHEILIKFENIIGFADYIVLYHSVNKIEEIMKKLQDKYATD